MINSHIRRFATIIFISIFCYLVFSKAPSMTAGRVPSNNTAPTEELINKLAILNKKLDDLTTVVEQLQSDYQFLLSSISQIKTDKKTISSKATPNTTETSPPILELNYAQLHEEARIATMERKARLSHAFEVEERDYEWSGSAESEITKLANSIFHSEPANVHTDCRTTMCKLVIYTASSRALEQLNTVLPDTLPWQGAMDISTTEYAPNEFSAEIIIAREGFPLSYGSPD
ncbi:hypothetical protein ABZN20_08920 [Methylococcus sp. ANG]|uniref:hypothetical protein n=1 Tax=Methylococcus sp. ANG TaxID=3231903 RepID=UPI00345A0A21